MKRGKKYLAAVLALAALLLCAAAGALAAVNKVPADRITLRMPEGMVLSPANPSSAISAGRVKLTIDSRKTGWSHVLVQGSDPSMVDVVVGIEPPEGAAWYVMECGSEEDELLDWLDGYDPEDYDAVDLAENGQLVAQYVGAYNVVSPWNENTYMYVRWLDAQYKELRTEKLHFTSAHTVAEGVYAPLRRIPAQDIVPQNTPQSGVKGEAGEGRVDYTITKAPDGRASITTRVRLPEGANGCRRVNIYEDEADAWLAIDGGYALLETEHPRSGAPKETFGLEFYEDDVLLDYGVVEIQHETKEMEPWPAYVAGWKPVPRANLHISIDGDSGVTMPYEDGVLSYDYAQVTGDPQKLQSAILTIEVTPPEGAEYVAWNSMGGGEGLLGDKHYDEEEIREMLWWGGEPEPIGGNVVANRSPLLQTLRTYDDVTLFIPTVPTDLDAGMAYYFAWYDSEQDAQDNLPSEVWWFTEKSEPFVTVHRNRLRADETALLERFDGAIAIGREDWTLVTERYLQQGERAQHYELHLTDGSGSAIAPDRNIVIYLPYPAGCAYGDGTVYTLRHYDTAGGSELVTTLTPTEYGLRFEADSLSPFVLTWADGALQTTPAPDVSKLPETGDDSCLTLWALLLALAAAGVLGLRRRRSA